jgi:transcriptional regulator with XRE-family HTH domain
MKTRTRRAGTGAVNLPLKLAIVASRRTQRRVALATRITEGRISEIVTQRSTPPTPDEQAKIAKYLGKAIAELFPVDALATERAS